MKTVLSVFGCQNCIVRPHVKCWYPGSTQLAPPVGFPSSFWFFTRGQGLDIPTRCANVTCTVLSLSHFWGASPQIVAQAGPCTANPPYYPNKFMAESTVVKTSAVPGKWESRQSHCLRDGEWGSSTRIECKTTAVLPGGGIAASSTFSSRCRSKEWKRQPGYESIELDKNSGDCGSRGLQQ